MSGTNGNGFSPRWWSMIKSRLGPSAIDTSHYRRLALQLHYDLPRLEGRRSALVVTPERSSLSAPSSVALAMSLGDELDQPVLLVDASPRSGAVSQALGCTGERGLSDLFAEPALSLEELTLETTHPKVSFLPAGSNAASASPATPEQLTALFEVASKSFDFVLLSGGSMLDESMALAAAPQVGCVLLLAVENETTVEELDAAQRALDYCRAHKVGLVLTTPLSGESWQLSK